MATAKNKYGSGKESTKAEEKRSLRAGEDHPERSRRNTRAGQQDRNIVSDEASDIVIPVTAETLEVSKKQVTTGVVRVTRHVSERTETVDETHFREDVEVERVPVNRFVETPPEVQIQGDTTIIPVLEEVLVVEKRLLVKEEIRITRKRKEVKDPQQINLKSEKVEVDRMEADEDNK